MHITELTIAKLARVTGMPNEHCREILMGLSLIRPDAAIAKRKGNVVVIYFKPFDATENPESPDARIMIAHGCSTVTISDPLTYDPVKMAIRESGTPKALDAAVKAGYKIVRLEDLQDEIRKAYDATIVSQRPRRRSKFSLRRR